MNLTEIFGQRDPADGRYHRKKKQLFDKAKAIIEKHLGREFSKEIFTREPKMDVHPRHERNIFEFGKQWSVDINFEIYGAVDVGILDDGDDDEHSRVIQAARKEAYDINKYTLQFKKMVRELQSEMDLIGVQKAHEKEETPLEFTRSPMIFTHGKVIGDKTYYQFVLYFDAKPLQDAYDGVKK